MANTCLVEFPAYLRAQLEGRLLAVYRSPLVHDDEGIFAPVRDILNSRKHRVLTAEVFKDDSMMFGEGLLTIYLLEEND